MKLKERTKFDVARYIFAPLCQQYIYDNALRIAFKRDIRGFMVTKLSGPTMALPMAIL
jgi:hypothetical protein